jgi:hypothetical protein
MGLQVQHEIHTRRFGRNLGVGLLLAAFVVLMLALTVVKVTRGGLAPHAADGKAPISSATSDAP